MDSPNRTRVLRALDALKPFLGTYVEKRLSSATGAQRQERDDMQALLKTMAEQWERVFAGALPAAARQYIIELRDIRNRWAHEAPFTDADARRAIDTIALTAVAIGAPASLLESLRALSAPDAGEAPPAPPARRVRKSAPPKAASAGPESAAVRRDVNGVIINAAELTADDVALQRVLCPACDRKVFKSWPLGWDAHAAHPCPGMAMGTDAERKTEYRQRYRHLFREEGKAAQAGE